MSTGTSLYVHVPFCERLCPYCDFYKLPLDSQSESLFLDALEQEIGFYAQRFPAVSFQTVYFGGGSPVALSTQGLTRLLRLVLDGVHMEPDAEVTLEMNPESVVDGALAVLRQSAVNRISVGAQSFHDSELKWLGRQHTAQGICAAAERLRTAGLGNFNLDLMYSFPGTTIESLRYSIDALVACGPRHVSVYALTIEKGTPFDRQRVTPLDGDLEARQYRLIQRVLKRNGYRQYEVSAFAEPGFESRHNRGYWTFRPYIGLGPGAHSFWQMRRYSQPRDLKAYTENPVPPIFRETVLPAVDLKALMGDFVMTGLRLRSGFSEVAFCRVFGVPFEAVFGGQAALLREMGMLRKGDGRVAVTSRGLMVLDSVVGQLLDGLS